MKVYCSIWVDSNSNGTFEENEDYFCEINVVLIVISVDSLLYYDFRLINNIGL
mgnify:CR=1 FL=1